MIRRDIDRLSQIYADDVSGRFVWMDLLENRGGKWVVVRSDGTRMIEPAPAAADGRRPRVLL
jgi:hypothetical protein